MIAERETIVDLAVAISRLRRFIEDNVSDKREYAEYRGYLNTLLNAPEIMPRPITGRDL